MLRSTADLPSASRFVYKCENPTDGYIGQIPCFMTICRLRGALWGQSGFFSLRQRRQNHASSTASSIRLSIRSMLCLLFVTAGDHCFFVCHSSRSRFLLLYQLFISLYCAYCALQGSSPYREISVRNATTASPVICASTGWWVSVPICTPITPSRRRASPCMMVKSRALALSSSRQMP